ncbi:MAG: hypothetical protein ACLPVY_09155 [Acidimicrobiia bacterium]
MIGGRIVAVGVVIAAVTAGGVAGAVIGIPGLSSASNSPSLATTAQSAKTNARPHGHGGFFGRGVGADQDLLAAAAKALNLSTPALLQKLSDGKTTIADVATQQHVALSTVTNAMDAVANTDISNLVNNPLPTFGHFRGKGPSGGTGGTGGTGMIGPGGVGAPMFGGLGFGLRGVLGGSINAVASALGISSKDLLGDLQKGQSIADIAKSKNVNLNTLIKTLVTDAQTQIDAAIKAGHLPQAIATKLAANLNQLITNAVNNTRPQGFGSIGGFGRLGALAGPGAARPMPAPPGPTS